jgi:hypothetical protein
MRLRTWLRVAAVAPLLALLPVTTMGAATASASAPTCLASRTSKAFLEGRPDSGNHGDWALDNFRRTVRICQTTAAAAGVAHYHAVVRDEGSFKTIAGAPSPRAGVAMKAASGVFRGGFTADFTADAGFASYHDFAHGGRFQGTAPWSTSGWVQHYFGADFAGSSINDDWSWTYWTCRERWTDGFPSAGSVPADGDITGKPCSLWGGLEALLAVRL